jgi:hypothetical protein
MKSLKKSFKNIVNQQENTTKLLPITDFCRILPTPVCKNNLLCMRHERTCHVFKGFIGKCEVCGERFTASKLIWNAVKLWNDQCCIQSHQSYFEKDVQFPLSKEQVDIVALRISYDGVFFKTSK